MVQGIFSVYEIKKNKTLFDKLPLRAKDINKKTKNWYQKRNEELKPKMKQRTDTKNKTKKIKSKNFQGEK